LEKVRELTKEFEAVDSEIKRVDSLLRTYQEKLKSSKLASKELVRVEEEIKKLRREYDELQATLGRLRAEKSNLEARIESIRKSLENLERAQLRLAILSYIRDYLFEETPKRLFTEYLSKLENVMSTILRRFGLTYTSIVIKHLGDDIEFRVISRDGTSMPLGSLSGGEKTAVGLAFVLALNTILARRVGFLVLDEPTSYLDEERRGVLVDILREFRGGKGIPQLLVVTHEEEVMDAADSICRVTWSSRGSKLSCNEGGSP